MRIFTRLELASHPTAGGRHDLLLEGHWPSEPEAAQVAQVWSLDEAIDARHGWIDGAAAEYAEAIGTCHASGRDETNVAYLNALALRYYLVKLLRVVAFFDQVHRPTPGEAVESHLRAGQDEDYAELLKQVADAHAWELTTVWHPPRRAPAPAAPRGVPWRRWAAHAAQLNAGRLDIDHRERNDPDRRRVVLCGNPRVLDGVCKALLERGCQVWWLYEHFAARSWWRWRRHGARQLTCDAGGFQTPAFSESATTADLVCRGVNLAPAVDRWLAGVSAELGRRQSRVVQRIDGHFRALRPTHLVLDEDATPLKRAAVAIARRWGARSTVVEHGAPCGPFGFAPLAADEICVWGESTRRELVGWGVPPGRIHVTGWPGVERRWPRWMHLAKRRRATTPPTILLLATVAPCDGRPDTVTFHLTRQTHEALVDMACAAVGKIAGARLIVKLHPRAPDAGEWLQVLKRHPALRHRVVRSADLDTVVAGCDCVLSCASTAGIEAALAGAPVAQLLPAGSGDVLPAERWGLIGSARDACRLDSLLATALARGWKAVPRWDPDVLGDGHRPAVERIADIVLERSNCLGARLEVGG
ncbi:MAG TPA: hypothetical protein VMV69_25125 [Pirellulales bacterium]|nr:hypothetical protein [Pirellulales bacterium]